MKFQYHLALTQARVAAAASEEAKDMGFYKCGYVPSVCESFGVWYPFALSTLFTIADHTTVEIACLIS